MTYVPKRAPLDPCPVEAVVALIAGKWKARILLELLTGPISFGELRRRLSGISQQVLSAQLRGMQADGIVSRTAMGSDPAAGSLYALTEEGRTLVPVLDGMAEWGLGRLRRGGLDWCPTPATGQAKPSRASRPAMA